MTRMNITMRLGDSRMGSKDWIQKWRAGLDAAAVSVADRDMLESVTQEVVRSLKGC